MYWIYQHSHKGLLQYFHADAPKQEIIKSGFFSLFIYRVEFCQCTAVRSYYPEQVVSRLTKHFVLFLCVIIQCCKVEKYLGKLSLLLSSGWRKKKVWFGSTKYCEQKPIQSRRRESLLWFCIMYVNPKVFLLQSLYPKTEKEADKIVVLLYSNFNAYVTVCGYLVKKETCLHIIGT